ncbi:MAG: VWA domain-containing protein [Myxococcales bacterium]|nr:VWA domain-containing protein [Myxococcales bacterium]MCB9643820.1 VWA domain-containing protein [Myxococcales bacterium]
MSKRQRGKRFMRVRWLLFLVCGLALSACVSLRLELHNASVEKPSNIALYFSVETTNQEPVAKLDEKSFLIYEDDQLISPFESKQTILNPQVAVVHYVLLLLDLSASITESGAAEKLGGAASAFIERMSKDHKIGVFGFDGSKELIRGVSFTSSRGSALSGVRSLSRRKPRDPSTNLNGAIVNAVDVLNKQLSRAKQPLRFGTLVVFSDGTDRAHRVTEEEMLRVLGDTNLNIFAIGMGTEISEAHLSRIGRTGYIKANDLASIKDAFEQVAQYIEASAGKFYLLSYCSPSRAGEHRLRVVAKKKDLQGSIEYTFNAEGFGPNCNPKRMPRFNMGQIKMPPVGRLLLRKRSKKD